MIGGNILSAIMGYTQLTAELIPEDSEAQGNLEEVFKASNRAASLAMQILSFSRQTEQDKIPVMLRPIVKEILKLLKATLPSVIESQENVGTIFHVYLPEVETPDNKKALEYSPTLSIFRFFLEPISL